MGRSGEWVTNFQGSLSYKSFRPAPLPPVPALEFDEELLELQTNANRHLSQLSAVSKLIPDSELFVSMYVRKEALISSQIEGAQCTLDDIFDPLVEGSANADLLQVAEACAQGAHAGGSRRGEDAWRVQDGSELDRGGRLHARGGEVRSAER